MTISKKAKNSYIYTIGLLFYSSTSFIYLVCVTRINGVDEAGIFTFAFSFSCLMQVIAMYAGRTYQVTERNKSISQFDYLIFKIFTSIIMFLTSAIYVCWIRDYDSYKTLIIFLLILYKCIESYSESIYAIFQRNNNLYQSGISMILKSISCTASFIIVDLITQNLIFSIIIMILTDILLFIVYDLLILKKYKIKINKIKLETIKKLFIGGLSVFLFTLLFQYLIAEQKYIIDFLLNNESQTIFGILVMPATFMAICSQMIINPFLYEINNALERKKYNEYKNINKKICIILLFISIPVLTATYFLGIPILNLIYNLDLNDYLPHLMSIIIGSIAFAFVSILSNALISIRKNIAQLILYAVVSVATTAISFILIKNYSIIGASVSFLISMILLFIGYILIYKTYVSKLELTKN